MCQPVLSAETNLHLHQRLLTGLAAVECPILNGRDGCFAFKSDDLRLVWCSFTEQEGQSAPKRTQTQQKSVALTSQTGRYLCPYLDLTSRSIISSLVCLCRFVVDDVLAAVSQLPKCSTVSVHSSSGKNRVHADVWLSGPIYFSSVRHVLGFAVTRWSDSNCVSELFK